ncbi:IclR family transcriptional regulator [Natrarchaeobius chitinivorans]|uniref:IclR family transcriptional regulator n=1 Tax=Natrarchaeobius chitinivorans TaxID=1679083 RepID=A0A3N6M174_NATCH|nr:IclR family transcriptional regulator [Natrarchaeobius chitinivorans]RQG95407.1 IclR family transcriptional regulator [Natrarchaeobius chitinivorans]
MTSEGGPRRRIKTADTVIDIFETLRELDGATTAELAAELDVATSTAHGYLSTLHDREFLVNDDGTYRVGLRSLDFGMYAKSRIAATEVVPRTLEQLADETEELVWFTVEEHGRAIDVEKAAGERAVTVGTWVGKRKLMHHLAGGKAILAHLPERRIRGIIDRHGLPKRTENTITDPAELFDELEQIRSTNIAFNDEETASGVRSVGTPIVVDGTPVGAIVISGPAKRMKGDRFRETMPDLLLAASNEVELKLRPGRS